MYAATCMFACVVCVCVCVFGVCMCVCVCVGSLIVWIAEHVHCTQPVQEAMGRPRICLLSIVYVCVAAITTDTRSMVYVLSSPLSPCVC